MSNIEDLPTKKREKKQKSLIADIFDDVAAENKPTVQQSSAPQSAENKPIVQQSSAPQSAENKPAEKPSPVPPSTENKPAEKPAAKVAKPKKEKKLKPLLGKVAFHKSVVEIRKLLSNLPYNNQNAALINAFASLMKIADLSTALPTVAEVPANQQNGSVDSVKPAESSPQHNGENKK